MMNVNTISGSRAIRPFICDSMESPQSCDSTCTFMDRLERKESRSSVLPISSTEAFTQSAALKMVLSRSDEFSRLMICSVRMEIREEVGEVELLGEWGIEREGVEE